MNMRNTVLTYIDRFRHDRRQRLVLGSVLLALAIVVSLTVYWQLRLSGIAMTNETYCGYEEHAHTEECYEYTLVCGYEEGEAENPEITHVHTDECYLKESILICELEEGEEHTHDESCFETQLVLICGQEEATVHVHTEECYENTLICELEEHVHTVDCLVNLEADIETAVDWEATLPELTGDLRTDIVNIAYSQIGYTESTANYTLAEDGVTHLGYTRYGAWYGGAYFESEYSDWDSMFVAFCLDYAGIAEEFTYNSGAYAWSVELSELGYYQTADVYTPEVGDVAFIDTDLDGRADVTAIVVAVDESAIAVIQGNYADTVALVEYALDETVLGYADVDYTEEVEEDEEITLDESDEIIAEEIEELDVSAEDFATLEFVGEDYIITVSYGEDAALPEGTELVAYEYAQDSETFLSRYEEASALYGWEDSDETNPYHGFRLFNIGLYYDGTEIEPAASVTVTVTYTGETDAASVSVTHFGNTATETLDATLTDGDDSQSVTFTADGFSDYGIMLTADAGTYTVKITNSIATDGKLTAVIYDESENEVEYSGDYTYTWYRSKEPYLTDSAGHLESAPAKGTVNGTDNYNYLLYNSSSFGATVSENYCNVNNTNGNTYVFYYYYVTVKINGTTYTSDIAYASVEGAASYVKIEKSSDGKTLTATLYDSDKAEINPSSDDNITYTYTWYKSRTYEASDGTTEIEASDAPYANTIANTNDYVKQSETSASLTLEDSDSFYFYYVIVTMKYTLTDDTTSSYTAYAKGYEDWAYAGLISSSGYTAVIVDNISSSGTFDAVLYDASGNVVDTSEGYTFTWYKSDDEYLTTLTSNIYSDQTHPSSINYSKVTEEDVLSGNTVNVAKDLGGLHYYYVEISKGNDKYTSAVKYVQYSDQIENGGFENGVTTSNYTSTNELNVVYWQTTNGEYSESHGSYRGYNSIEIGRYGGSTALVQYYIAYSKAGDAAQNNYFAELNATEASTLYQTVITAPGTIYYWSVYHQNRKYSESNVSSTEEGQQQNDYYRLTTKGTGTDSMYVIIMSNEDAEKLLDEVDNSTEYSSQQDVIDAAAEYIIAKGTKTTNGSVDVGNSDDHGSGEIDGSYSGKFELSDGTAVDVTLWKVTTTKTVTEVLFYTDSGYTTYADVESLAYTDYLTSEGWAPLTTTSNGVTITYGYYKVTDWVEYSGSYTVPDGQYLTRFFFAAASAQGGNAAGNFIDSVSLTASVNYTIEYWVWDTEKEAYVIKNSEDTEKGTVSPYTRVSASKLGNYSDYVVVGSVTGSASGGSDPAFDSSTKTSMKVDAYTNYLSIYLNNTGVAVEKVISGLSSAALDNINESVNFTITDSSSNTITTFTVTPGDTGEASKYIELDDGTYTVSETSYKTSLLDGKYLWVGAKVTGTSGTDNENGTYSFTLDNNNPSQTITFTNYYLPVVTLKKVDSTLTSKTLSGVTFEMYMIDGSDTYYYESCSETTHEITWSDTAVSLTTDADGTIAYSALPDGTYYLEETKTVDGYNLLTETLSFTIKDGAITAVDGDAISIDTTDPYSLTLIVENDPGVELPSTGDVSLPVAYAVGSLMILASAIGLVVRRKKI